MSAHSHAFAMAVAATAAAMLLLAGIFFYFFQKFARSRYHHRHRVAASFRREAGLNHKDVRKVGSNMKELLVEENGTDILYMTETEGWHFRTSFPTRIFNPSYEDYEEEKRIDVMVQRSIQYETQDVPLLCESPGPGLIDHEDLLKPVSQVSSLQQLSQQPTPVSSIPQPSPMILEKKTEPPPPPPPPPPPSPPRNNISKGPPLPSSPIMNREGTTSTQKANGLISSLKPPPPPKGKASMENTSEASVGESSREKASGQTRLKPLHWDKVVANVDHSTVWDQINDGSFR